MRVCVCVCEKKEKLTHTVDSLMCCEHQNDIWITIVCCQSWLETAHTLRKMEIKRFGLDNQKQGFFGGIELIDRSLHSSIGAESRIPIRYFRGCTRLEFYIYPPTVSTYPSCCFGVL